MDACQFAVYQMKCTPAYRHMRFRPYRELQDKGIRVGCGDYVQAYLGHMHPQETPEDIRHRLCKQLPRNFHGHSISTGDVFVLNKAGVVVSYYVEKESFTVLPGFFHKDSAALSIETSNYHIEGKNGGWNAIDSVIVDGREFFLMEHDNYGSAGACVVLDENGKLAIDGVRDGFDPSVMWQIADYLHQPGQGVEERPEADDGEKQEREQPAGAVHLENDAEKQAPEHAAGSLESGMEKQPPDGAGVRTDTAVMKQKKPKKNCGRRDGRKPGKRASVLEKLRRKQAEIAERSRQAAQQ